MLVLFVVLYDIQTCTCHVRICDRRHDYMEKLSPKTVNTYEKENKNVVTNFTALYVLVV